ncbi:MAG TPA: c-type cytochrome [Gemmatimonadaceae bacterium]|nr:c-type cytochrome [Gemmatimonadaceae bacterium]
MTALRRALPIVFAVFTVGVAVSQAPSDLPAWIFPGGKPDSTVADSTRLHRVPNSRARFTLPQVVNRFAPPDWHPGGHPPMPEIVAHGRKPNLFACAYCHLPNGMGRPENATLAGLPEDYIIAQLAAFRSSTRGNPSPGWVPGNSMHAVAMNATEAEVAAAARYFSGLRFTPRARVVEAARIPRTREAGFVYARIPGPGTEPIGSRIVEGPPDFERHELRDDGMTYVAYVPPGSIRRGRSIAKTGRNGLATACVTCHGPNLGGTGLIPPLAGRFPTYIVRQLVAFKTGARSTPASQPMQAVVAQLSVDDMIAVAAYAATLAPAPHSR